MAITDDISTQLERILKEYEDDFQERVDKAIMAAGKQAKRIVVSKSPSENGEYKSGWKVRNKRSGHVIETVVYNAANPGLTHLLEKSHVIKNQFGSYGRTGPGHGQVEHIGPAQREAEEFLLDELKKL